MSLLIILWPASGDPPYRACVPEMRLSATVSRRRACSAVRFPSGGRGLRLLPRDGRSTSGAGQTVASVLVIRCGLGTSIRAVEVFAVPAILTPYVPSAARVCERSAQRGAQLGSKCLEESQALKRCRFEALPPVSAGPWTTSGRRREDALLRAAQAVPLFRRRRRPEQQPSGAGIADGARARLRHSPSASRFLVRCRLRRSATNATRADRCPPPCPGGIVGLFAGVTDGPVCRRPAACTGAGSGRVCRRSASCPMACRAFVTRDRKGASASSRTYMRAATRAIRFSHLQMAQCDSASAGGQIAGRE